MAQFDLAAQLEPFLATMTRIFMKRGDAQSGLVLIAAAVEAECTGGDFGVDHWTLHMKLSASLYTQLDSKERNQTASRIQGVANELLIGYEDSIDRVAIAPKIEPPAHDAWRGDVQRWIKGEGVNNQGRVQSANPAQIEEHGLLFRSKPEVMLFKALKETGVYFAPLPVFLHGGTTYDRLEPDFFIVVGGRSMIVEVDGPWHTERPDEAQARLRALNEEGIHIERRAVDECDTIEKARVCVRSLLDGFAKWRASTR